MSIRSRALVVLAVAFLPSSCGYVRLPRSVWPPAADGRPVALLMEGSAFVGPVRARTEYVLEGELGRPVRVVEALPTAADDETKALAARVVGSRSLRYDWREPQCAWDRTLLAGVTHDVDAVYRAVVDYSERERPATDYEWDELRGFRTGFRRLRERPMVREEIVTGAVARSALVLHDAVARASVYGRRVSLASDRERIDVAVAIAETVRGLPELATPEWDGLARRLLKQGCPFLALAIADTQLVAGERESVQTAAVAAMRAGPGRGAARERPANPVRTTPATRQPEEPSAGTQATAGAPEPSEPPAEQTALARATSCRTLCEMHMVEICNTDKVLWSAHRARWEATPCGTRRDEGFLAQCYQEQWDTGTFDTSCVQPCEASDAGRSRLMAILQEAGCVAGPGPS